MAKSKVSVIIPVYNVASYIERCARSLFGQTLREMEFIFVDDSSPDRSIQIVREVLKEFPHRVHQVKFLRHEQNKGLPAARNTGLRVATGEYIYHCDSDDYLEPDALETMYRAAKANDADIVWCDWFLSFEHNERYMKQPGYPTAYEALRGILNGRMKYNVWNKLVRRELYTQNDIWFPSGYGMGEDMTMIRLFACAGQVAYVPRAFYHYVKLNREAFTNTMSERHLSAVLHNTAETVTFLQERYGSTLEGEIGTFKLTVKYPFLIGDDWSQYRLWKNCFPEANPFISRFRQLSLRSWLLQLAALHGHYWLLWLHYKLVYKLMYGIIYK